MNWPCSQRRGVCRPFGEQSSVPCLSRRGNAFLEGLRVGSSRVEAYLALGCFYLLILWGAKIPLGAPLKGCGEYGRTAWWLQGLIPPVWCVAARSASWDGAWRDIRALAIWPGLADVCERLLIDNLRRDGWGVGTITVMEDEDPWSRWLMRQ